MALMSSIVNDVLIELRFGAGVDVQIHLQESIVKNISRCYRTLMKKHVWRDYHLVSALTIDEATGQAIQPMEDVLTKFSNIIAVYLENHPDPLPFAPLMINPRTILRPVVVSSGGSQIFTIYPIGEARNISLISKVFSEEDFEMEDDVPFYRDVLALCSAWQLSVKAGTNDDLTKSLHNQYLDLLDTYVMDEMQDKYQLNRHIGDIPTQWSVS